MGFANLGPVQARQSGVQGAVLGAWQRVTFFGDFSRAVLYCTTVSAAPAWTRSWLMKLDDAYTNDPHPFTLPKRLHRLPSGIGYE